MTLLADPGGWIGIPVVALVGYGSGSRFDLGPTMLLAYGTLHGGPNEGTPTARSAQRIDLGDDLIVQLYV